MVRKKFFPRNKAFFLDIEITNVCNTRCLICPRDKLTRSIGMMSVQTFEQIVDKLSNYEFIKTIGFCGIGECLLNKNIFDFVKMLRKVKQNKTKIQIITNGYNLTPSTIDKLIEARVDGIDVSIQAVDPELYRLLMPGLELKKVLDNLKYLVKVAPSYLKTSVNITIHKMNKQELSPLMFLAQDLGIKNCYYNNIHSRGGNLQDTRFIDGLSPNLIKECDIFERIHFISWEGKILSCCHDLGGENVIGDIYKHSFEDINQIKENIMKKNKWWYTICKYCNDLTRQMLP